MRVNHHCDYQNRGTCSPSPSPSLVCNSSAVIAASIVDTHHVFKVLGQIFDDGTNDFCLIEQRNDNPRMGFSIRFFR